MTDPMTIPPSPGGVPRSLIEEAERLLMRIRASAGSDPSFETNREMKTQWANELEALLTALTEAAEKELELLELVRAIYQAARTDEKGECWTIRAFLEQRGVYDGNLTGMRRLVEEACKSALTWAGTTASLAPPQAPAEAATWIRELAELSDEAIDAGDPSLFGSFRDAARAALKEQA